MNMSKKDRLFLINQYKILALLNKDEADYFNELINILENGYEIFYSMISQWVFDDMPTNEGKFVLDILDFYRALENLKRSSESEELLNHSYSYFYGFDGNNETNYMSFARFLIEEQGKFSEQQQYMKKNDSLNSHMALIPKYRRMLDESGKIDIWNMNVEQALKILSA